VFLKVFVLDSLKEWNSKKHITKCPVNVACYITLSVGVAWQSNFLVEGSIVCFAHVAVLQLTLTPNAGLLRWSKDDVDGSQNQGLVVAGLGLFSMWMVVCFLAARLMARRCFAPHLVPVALFPIHLTNDLFTEIMVPNLLISDAWFWIIVLWDIFLLVLRDADLWTDMANFVKRRFGPVVLRLIEMSQLLVGHGGRLVLSQLAVVPFDFASVPFDNKTIVCCRLTGGKLGRRRGEWRATQTKVHAGRPSCSIFNSGTSPAPRNGYFRCHLGGASHNYTAGILRS
jgi:hypothetical protein